MPVRLVRKCGEIEPHLEFFEAASAVKLSCRSAIVQEEEYHRVIVVASSLSVCCREVGKIAGCSTHSDVVVFRRHLHSNECLLQP